MSRQYDSLSNHFSFDYHGVIKRSSFIIDKEGRIVFMEILPQPGDYPDMQKIREIVASLK